MRLYPGLGSSSVDVSMRGVSTKLTTWLAIIAPTLLPFITESKMGVVSYNPQLSIRQLGYDQSAIQLTGEMVFSDLATTQSQFVGGGRHTSCSSSKEFSGPRQSENRGEVPWRFDLLEDADGEVLYLCGGSSFRVSRDPENPNNILQ